MQRYRMLVCASAVFALAAAGCGGGTPEATEEVTPLPAPPATPGVAPALPPSDGTTLVAPVRGQAEVGYTKPAVKNGTIDGRQFIITTMQVKNLSSAPIAGLKIDEFWYDRNGDPVSGDSYRHPRPLQVDEVVTITLETPRNPAMDSNQYNFTHANGEVMATLFDSFDSPDSSDPSL